MGRRYKELSEEYRKLQSKYNYSERRRQELKEEYKEQEEILNNTKKLNGLLEEKINELKTEKNIDQQKINILMDKNIYLTEKNENLKKIIEEKHSDWYIVADNAWRYRNGYVISYEIPDPFIRGYEHNVKFDRNFKMIEFLYTDWDGRLLPYKMPLELYHLLGGNIFSKISDRYSPYVEPLYEDEDEIKRIFIKKGISLKGKYIEELLGFVLKNQSSTYSIKDFGVCCGFLNRETRRNYHNKLKKAGMVKEVGKDLYEFVRVDT